MILFLAMLAYVMSLDDSQPRSGSPPTNLPYLNEDKPAKDYATAYLWDMYGALKVNRKLRKIDEDKPAKNYATAYLWEMYGALKETN